MNTGGENQLPSTGAPAGLQDMGFMAGFLEAAFDAVIVSNAQERITYWNPAAEQMFGWTAPEALGKTSAELFWPLSTASEKKRHRQRQLSLQQGAMLRGEYSPCHKDGSSLWVQYTAWAIFDAEGKTAGYLTLYRDISTQMRLREKEEQLKQSNQKLNDILESIQDDFYVLDRDWKFVYASRSFTSKIGKEPADFIGKNIWKMFPKHIGTTFEENLRATMEKDEIRSFEIPGKYTNAWYRMKTFPSAEGITVLGTDITERKRAEQALQDAVHFSSKVMESALNGLYIYDIVLGKNIYINSMYERLIGYSWDDLNRLSSEQFFELFHPEDRRAISEHMEQLQRAQDGETISVEYRFRKRNGEWAWYLSRDTVFERDPDGNVRQFIGSFLDITEQKRTEAVIRESEERFRTMANNLPFMIWVTNARGEIEMVNRTYEEFFGVKEEQVMPPGTWQPLVHPDDRKAYISAYLKSIEKRTPFFAETRVKRADGEWRWIASQATLRFTLNGEFLGHVGSSPDITERKRTEEQLRELSQRLTYHVDNSPLAVIEWGPDMRLIRWSGAAERIFGWKAEEVLGKRMEDFRWIYEEDAQQVNKVSSDLRTGGDPQRFSANRNYRKDGSVAHCEWYNTSLVDDSGNLRSILSLVLDVTERKKAEEALRASENELQLLNQSLEQKVQEKTTQVRGLASDLVKVEQRERNRISQILHDDLQQRVYALQMDLMGLRDALQVENATAYQEMSNIERQMEEIRQGMRHLSVELSPPILQEEDLSQAIRWLAAQMLQQYKLPIEVHADGTFAVADQQLHVLVFNCVRELLFNVVKHAQASQAMVTLQKSDVGLEIEVRDNGRGFPIRPPKQDGEEAELSETFGLPTIRHQLSFFSGGMEIQSEPGAGTRVVLSIPVKDSVD